MREIPTLARDASTDDGQLERLGPDELDHVTMAVTVDVSDLAPPEVNWLIGKAKMFERQFTATAWGNGIRVGNYDPSQKNHADGEGFQWINADYVTMSATVNTSELGGTETGMLMGKAREFEKELQEIVREKRAS